MKKLISILCLACSVMIVGSFYSCSRKEEVTTLSSNFSLALEDDSKESTTDKMIQLEVKKDIYVHICGEVMTPGVYKISEDTRLYELIELAGGLTKEAVGDAVNQAALLEDGQKVYIPTIEDIEDSTLFFEDTIKEVSDGLININTATKEELMSLPGIGLAKANSIIDYRSKNGAFNSIEDIKSISGIKDSVYNKISDKIKVK